MDAISETFVGSMLTCEIPQLRGLIIGELKEKSAKSNSNYKKRKQEGNNTFAFP